MKLRLRGNSVRLRLSKSEVEELVQTGLLEDSVEFAPNPLVYMVHASRDCASLEVTFRNGWITLSVPEEKMRVWADGNEVGMESNCRGVSVLIEKDWTCLHKDESENQDSFPRPAP